MKEQLISFKQALQLTLSTITPLDAETVPLSGLVNRVAASDLYALVNAPASDVSLKDGYAICPADIAQASPDKPVQLRITDTIAAGGHFEGKVSPGTAVRILSGARIPVGAGAVVAEEFTRRSHDRLTVIAPAEPGRNILPRGTDIHIGQRLVSAGTFLCRPAQIGLLAAAGYSQAAVVRQPRVAIIATGDEVIAPGQVLEEGKVFASNLVTLAAWCSLYGFSTAVSVIKDEAEAIREHLLEAVTTHDAILTSGGAWRGDRDLVVKVLDQLGWQKIYHRVKIGPGKAVGFGIGQGKPLFCLPGGPPSNQMAFIQLGLPGLQKLAGYRQVGLPQVWATLAQSVSGQEDWTQFLEGRFEDTAEGLRFRPVKQLSRLQTMATTEGLLAIPEGTAQLPAGARVQIQLLPGFQLTGGDDE
ncbi:MAG: molybdopterin molybdotransferase MoeA [Anaerolineae bacterium]|nr:molybdopterin molybdotransferase MoeA [Anaerolineae bacterium]